VPKQILKSEAQKAKVPKMRKFSKCETSIYPWYAPLFIY